MAGTLVLVVGPSGAGKDTLIAAARAQLAGDAAFVFPRRLVTRHAVPQLEDHDTMSWEEFASGDFALSWEAHGLGYALPRVIEGDLDEGRTVIANVSRKVIANAAARYACGIVVITATPEVRAARLAGRGRESATDVAARLAREGAEVPAGLAQVIVVDNSGTLEPAVDAFVAAIRVFAHTA
jgi:phosphonate metabolism protein PhnN/1,5-bisphosphokinase (PRPP-forming)